jgi:S-DNA-T family DNA segregation ATPase FtsK/SpoIIIE
MPTHLLSRLTTQQRLTEAVFLLSCGFSLFILVSLVTYHPFDAGWHHVNATDISFNYGGVLGAWLADMLLSLTGYVAYTLPFVFVLCTHALGRHYMVYSDVDVAKSCLRLVGGSLTCLSMMVLLSMNAPPIYVHSGGGIAGAMLMQVCLPYLNWVGTSVMFLSLFASGITLLFGIKIIDLIDYVGAFTISTFNNLVTLIQFCFQRVGGQSVDQTASSFKLPKGLQRFWQRIQALFTRLQASFHRSQPAERQAAAVAPDMPRAEPVFETAAEAPVEVEPLSIDISLADTYAAEQASLTALTAPSPLNIDHFEPLSTDQTVSSEPVMAAAPTRPVDNNPVESPISSPSKSSSDAPPAAKPASTSTTTPPTNIAEPVKVVVVEPPSYTQTAPLGLPDLSLLDQPNRSEHPISQEALMQIAHLVESKLEDFNIKATVVDVVPGPVITRFELDLAPGVKVSKITALSKDLARSLSAVSVRVVEVIPGKSVIGLELPNLHRETVYLTHVLDAPSFHQHPSNVAMVLGADIAGQPVVVDLAKMPHLLVAGTTGSGKSVGVNVMIVSLLYKSTPEDVRLIMIDPKMLELSVYEGIPHLLCEVVTDMKQASNALRWCVGEMERRYQVMSALGVRNIQGYNDKIQAAQASGQPIMDPLWDVTQSAHMHPPVLEKMASIVVVVDEFADMMMIVGKKVEELIARIAQKARAAGIHLILATQRPSVDVITGLIKANVPTRMAFQVSSKIDSRTILDQQGAETLLGMGDMLYLPPGTGVPIRVHGAFVADHEVHRVVADWKQRAEPQYIDLILEGTSDSGDHVLLPGETDETDSRDALYDEAVAFVTETRRGSISSVQRKFKIGYNRAARIIEDMEAQGVVSAPMNNGNREVLAHAAPKVPSYE